MNLNKILTTAVAGLAVVSSAVLANVGWGDRNDAATELQPVYYANSPRGDAAGDGYHDPVTDAAGATKDCLAAPVAGSATTSPAGVTKQLPNGATSTYTIRGTVNTGKCYTGVPIRKFVDQLPGVKAPTGLAAPTGAAGAAIDPANKYVPVAVPKKWKNPNNVVTGDDYYEIAVIEFKEKLHTDLPASTLRGYVQIDPYCTDTNAAITTNDNSALSPVRTYGSGCGVQLFGLDGVTPLKIPRPTAAGTVYVNAYAVDAPHYLGPVINATKNVATRVKFYNLLPVGHAVGSVRNGDLPIPLDETLAGAGFGPDGVIKFSQNRSTIHLHGGDNPWISDGTPHQWIAPAGEGDVTDIKSSAYAVSQLTSTSISITALVPGRSYTIVSNTGSDFRTVGAANNNVNTVFVATGPGTGSGTVKLTPVLATATQLGEIYVIATVGSTNFTACGASANTVGTVFTATGACAGSGTAVVTTNYLRGASQKNVPDMLDPGPGAATFYYPNGQSVRMLWYHDHTYGLTRLNVYMGQASAYMLHDTTEHTNMEALLGAGYDTNGFEIPLVLQDKSFVPLDVATQDAKWDRTLWGDYGDLWYPHVYEVNQARARMNQGANPSGRWDWGPMFAGAVMPYYGRLPSGDHALVGSSPWVNNGSSAATRADQMVGVGGTNFVKTGLSEVTVTPEAFFDTPMVNGQAYPTTKVAARPYRLRVLNAANDRFFNLGLYVAADKATYPAKWPFDAAYSPTWLANNAPNMCTGTPWAATTSVTTNAQLVFGGRYYKVVTGGITGGTGPVSETRNATETNGGAVLQYLTKVADCTEVLLVDQAKFDDVIASAVANPGAGRDEPGLFGDYWGSAYTKGIFFDPVPYPGMDAEYLGPAMEMMGNESGFLPKPAHIPPTPVSWVENPKDIRFMTVGTHGLYLPAAGRADVVIDFTKYAGKTLILYNDSPAPAPVADVRNGAYTYGGDLSKAGGQEEVYPGYGPNVRTVMQIYVDPDMGKGTLPAYTAGDDAAFKAAVNTAVTTMYQEQHTLVVDPTSNTFGTVGTGTFSIPTGTGANATYGYEGLSFVPPNVGGSFPDGNMYYSVSPNPTTCTLLSPLTCPVVTETLQAGTTRLTPVNAGSFTPGMTYQITELGGTDWVAAGNVPTNTTSQVGEVFTATSTGANFCTSCTPVQSMTVGQSYKIDSMGSFNNTTPFDTYGTCTNPSPCGAGSTILITSDPSGAPGDGAGHNVLGGKAKPRLTAYVEGKLISEAFETTYGRMNAQLGVENVMTNQFVNNIIPLAYIDVPTETTKENQVHFWKMDHLGVDSHPVHFHQFDVQVISRIGLDGMLHPVMDDEQGWKETVIFNPLEVAYVAIRAKTPKFPFGLPDSNRMNDPSQPLGATAGFTQLAIATAAPVGAAVVNTYMGTPGNNYMWEYVWHCHILGHEENDFMRPILFDFWQGDTTSLATAPSNFAAAVSGGKTTLTWTDNTPATGTTFTGGIAASGRNWILTVTGGTAPLVGQVIAGDGVPLATTVSTMIDATHFNVVSACGACAPMKAVASGTAMYVSNRSDEIGFTISRTTMGTGLAAGNQNFSVPANVVTFVDPDVTSAPAAGKAYKYTIVAYNRNGSSVVNAGSTTALDGGAVAPTGLAASAITASSVTLSWTRGGQNEAGFNVYYTPSGGSEVQFGTTLAPTATTVQVTGLNFSTAYRFRVVAVTFSGLTNASSVNATTLALSAAPATATISLVTATYNVATVTWVNPGTFGGTTYVGGNLRVCKASNGAGATAVCPANYTEVTNGLTIAYNNNTTSATVSGLPENETLKFVIGVVASGNQRNTTNAGGGIYQVYPTTQNSGPALVTNLVATKPANCTLVAGNPACSVKVTWTNLTQTGTKAANVTYALLRNGVAMTPAVSLTSSQISRGSTGYTDATALPGTAYTYSIMATNTALATSGTSLPSASITTPNWFASPLMGTIAGTSVTGTSPSLTATNRTGTITINWTNKSAGVAGQSVYWRSCTTNPCNANTAWSNAPVAGTVVVTGATTGSTTTPLYNGTYALTFTRSVVVPTGVTNRWYEFEVRTGVGSGTRVTPPANGAYTAGTYAPTTSVVRFKF